MRISHFRIYCLLIIPAALFMGCDLFVEPAGKPDTDISNENIDSVIAEGLESWRKKGAIIEGAACANCHAPDALDLAYFDFDEKTIQRRAIPHMDKWGDRFSGGDVNKVIKMVKALRLKYDIEPRDHMTTRPFQPGGEVLPGSTPADRDRAFGRSLKTQGYRFANVPVLGEEEALKQRDEWLSINPRKIKIGIPFNRWSEDAHHGSEHSTMADWLPETPRIPREGRAREWYELQDQYLQNPTDENFWEMYAFERNLTVPDEERNSNRFFHERYQSVLLAQHIFRKEVMEGEQIENRPSTAFMPENGMETDNPVWDVGAIAHVLRNGDLRGATFDLPPTVERHSDNIAEEMERIRVPWFFAGWLLDQGLQHSGEGEVTESARYFTLHMHVDDSYPIHNIYMITRKMIVENFDSETNGSDKPLSVNYSTFNNYNFAVDYQPQDPEAREIYRLMTGNSYRMMLLLIKKEIRETGIPLDNRNVVDNWRETVQDFKEYTEQVQSEHHQYNLQLIAEVETLLE